MTGYYLVKAGQFHREERARIYFGSYIEPTYGAETPVRPISLFLLKGRSRHRGNTSRVREPETPMRLMLLVRAHEQGRTLPAYEPVWKELL
jgi:hypothetical protein